MTDYHEPDRIQQMNIEFQEKLLNRMHELDLKTQTILVEVQSNHKAFRDFQRDMKETLEKHNDEIYGAPNLPSLTSLRGLPKIVHELSDEIGKVKVKMALWTGGGIVAVFIIKAIFHV